MCGIQVLVYNRDILINFIYDLKIDDDAANHRRVSSVNFEGKTFLPENYAYEKLIKCLNCRLRDIFPKNYQSGGGVLPSTSPVSYIYAVNVL